MSSILWNLKDLAPPPNFTNKNYSVDVGSLKMICEKALSVLRNMKTLHVEAALLSRFLYNYKTKCRSDKGVNILEKVNRGLLTYLSLNLVEAYNNFGQCVPLTSDPDRYVPTRQMLQYLLVRTQSFSQLWCKIVKYCESAALYLRGRIGVGQIWGAAFLGFGIVSRIWTIGKYLVQSACEWYLQLLPYLNDLEPSDTPWLPEDYSFPGDLVQWLDVPWLQKVSLSVQFSEEKRNIFDVIHLASDREDCETNLEEIKCEDTVNNGGREIKVQQKCSSLLYGEQDFGELISRELATDLLQSDLQCSKTVPSDESLDILEDDRICTKIKVNSTKLVLSPTNNLIKGLPESTQVVKYQIDSTKRKSRQCVEKFKNHSDLVSFIENENELREIDGKQCSTRNLDRFQWHMLQNSISSYISKLVKLSAKGDKVRYKLYLKKAQRIINLTIS